MVKALAFILFLLSIAPLVIFAKSSSLDLSQINAAFLEYRDFGNGYSEIIARDRNYISLQRTAVSGNDSLLLLEVTNGTEIVQLIFSPQTLLSDCDVSNSKKYIDRLVRHVSAKHLMADFQPKDTLQPLDMDMESWIRRCVHLHSQAEIFKTIDQQNQIAASGTVSRGLEVMKDRSKNEDQMYRSRRGIFDLTYPGTKWCGKGNSAKNFNDLGKMKHTDKCCRQHDLCTDIIPALSSKYNYFNFGLLTVSSCHCDRKFEHCLRKANASYKDSIAELIGHLYFNVIGMECFILVERDYCTESSWWGRCLKTEKKLTAAIKNDVRY